MILSGRRIARGVARGDIEIYPFDAAELNPNSFNYRLGSEIADVGSGEVSQIGNGGFLLVAGRLYLGHTVERIGSEKYTPLLIGRSSVGRLGLFVQVDADLGQIGAVHCWTLELRPTHGIVVYAGMRIGQVSFWETRGRRTRYRGPYADFDTPTGNLQDLRP